MAGPLRDKKRSSELWAFAVLSAGLAVSLLVPAAALARLPSVCAFHHLGLPCWGCGLSRAFCALGHGELSQALHYHPLSPFLFGAWLALWSVSGWRVLRPLFGRR